MKAIRFLRVLPLVMSLLASPALASQATIVGPIVGPHTMADVMGTINAAFLAIQGCNSGSSAPANGPSAAPVSFEMWCDTTANPVVVKMYDGASWVVVGKLNTSSHIWTPSYQGTDLGTASIATTGTSGHTVPFLDGTNTISGAWNLGTPSAAVLTSATGLPVSTGISGLGTGVATFLGSPSSANLRAALTDEVGTGSAYFIGGALGTPASVTLTNGTSLPISGLSGLGTNVATALGNATNGTGGLVGFSGNIGAASGTSLALTSASASALAVGLNGATNPAFVVNASTALQAAGLSVTGNATGNGVALSVIDSGTNSPISINSKGSSGLVLQNIATGPITLSTATTLSGALTYGGTTFANTATGSGSLVGGTGPSIAGGALSGTFSGTPTLSGANFITRANLAQVAAASLSGNPTGSTANESAVTLGSTLNFSGTTLNATTATSSQLGVVKPDGVTITASGGVLTASGGSATAVTVGTTSIVSGTSGCTITDNAGVIGCVTSGPTTQTFLTGGSSGTYTTAAGTAWIEIWLVGGGSGGAGGGTSTSGGVGTAGGNTCWNTSGAACTSPVYQAGGGAATVLNTPSSGGTVSGSGSPVQAFAGGGGQGGAQTNSSGGYMPGGHGGSSCKGGEGAGAGAGSAGTGAAANSGSGGGGGGSSVGAASVNMGTGGAAGACLYAIINSPASTYTYAVAANGSAGAAGTTGTAGGNGSPGGIWVVEHHTK